MILWGFIKKEILQMMRNRIMVVAILIMPLVQVIVITFALNNEAKNLNLGFDCKPNDYLMREIQDRTVASGWFSKVGAVRESPFRAIQMGKYDAVLIAPEKGFTRSVGRRDPQVQLLVDGTNVLKAQAIEAYVKSIFAAVLKENKLSCPIPRSKINFKTRILFNPETNSTFYIYPFLIVIIVTVSMLSLACISITREKETGTMETLIAAPIKSYHIIFGKCIPYTIVGLINFLLMIALGENFFNMPFRGSFSLFVISFFVFAFTITMFAVLLSTFCQTQQQAMLAIMTFLFLSLMLSGGMVAVENMPTPLYLFANLLPLSHFTSLARNIMLKGSDLQYFFSHVGAIFAFGCLTAYIAFRKFKTTL